jgi:hypothetical protein
MSRLVFFSPALFRRVLGQSWSEILGFFALLYTPQRVETLSIQ